MPITDVISTQSYHVSVVLLAVYHPALRVSFWNHLAVLWLLFPRAAGDDRFGIFGVLGWGTVLTWSAP